jgi:hypothetical protein
MRVDPLVVGHRLMAAGEYELALKAYYPAASERGFNADVLSGAGFGEPAGSGGSNQAETDPSPRDRASTRPFVPAWNNLGVALMETGEGRRGAERLPDGLCAR